MYKTFRLEIFLCVFFVLFWGLSFSSVLAAKKVRGLELKDSQAKMLFQIDYREFDKDRITEYRFFDEGFASIVVTHDPAKNNPKFTSHDARIVLIDKTKMAKVKQVYEQLRILKFKNNFPWKENFTKRGDIYYVHVVQDYEPLIEIGANKTIAVPQVFIFYRGYKDSYPPVYAEFTDLLSIFQNN